MASSPYLPLAPLPGSSLSRSQGCPHQEYLLTRLALLAALTTNMLSDKVGRKKSSRAGNNVRNHPLPPPGEGEVGPASRSHNQLLGEASVALSHFSPSCFTSQHRACCQGTKGWGWLYTSTGSWPPKGMARRQGCGQRPSVSPARSSLGGLWGARPGGLSPLLLPQSFSLLNTLSPQHPHLGCVFSAVCSIFLPSPLHSQLPCDEGRSS